MQKWRTLNVSLRNTAHDDSIITLVGLDGVALAAAEIFPR